MEGKCCKEGDFKDVMNMGINRLDRYILKKFIVTFLIAMLLIIGIVIIFDVSEKIDNFVSNEVPLKEIIFDYYLNFIPYFINLFSPLFIFITVIFFTSRMAANCEIIAILSCGISFKRMMVPYLVSAAILAMMSLSLNLFVIPNANNIRLGFENSYIKNRNVYMRNVHYQVEPGKFVYVESFSLWNNTAYKFTIEDIEDNKVISKISAETAVLDTATGVWKLNRYFRRDYLDGLDDNVEVGSQLDTALNLTVNDFVMNTNTIESMPEKKLIELIRAQKMRGDANVMYAQIERNNRVAMPFSAFVLTIIGVSLSSRKKRGGIGWNIGVGIGLSFIYIFFMKFSQMFVYTGLLVPIVAIWLPNILFGIIALVLYRLAPK